MAKHNQSKYPSEGQSKNENISARLRSSTKKNLDQTQVSVTVTPSRPRLVAASSTSSASSSSTVYSVFSTISEGPATPLTPLTPSSLEAHIFDDSENSEVKNKVETVRRLFTEKGSKRSSQSSIKSHPSKSAALARSPKHHSIPDVPKYDVESTTVEDQDELADPDERKRGAVPSLPLVADNKPRRSKESPKGSRLQDATIPMRPKAGVSDAGPRSPQVDERSRLSLPVPKTIATEGRQASNKRSDIYSTPCRTRRRSTGSIPEA